MRRVVASLAVAALAVPWHAAAEVRDVSMGNYWFEDDQNGRRDAIVVDQGDQVRFTVREPDYPPHSVNIDELGIRSGDLLLFDTYTTPPLDTPGTFRIYCEAHRDRGHVTNLVVRAAPAASPPPASTTATPSQQATAAQEPAPAQTQTTAATASGSPSAPATPAGDDQQPVEETEDQVAPVGRGVATDRRLAEPDPDSLAGLLGRAPGSGPWTHGVRLALVTGIPIWAVTALAARRQRARDRLALLPTAEPVVVLDLDASRLTVRGDGASSARDASRETVKQP